LDYEGKSICSAQLGATPYFLLSIKLVCPDKWLSLF
jgi:hypothetical protein